MRRMRFLLCAALLVAPLVAGAQQPQPPPPPSGEAKIRQQREELDRIRQERAELQRNMNDLQTKAHDLGEEVTNLHQQADATARVVASLDVQLETITTEVDGTTSSLLRAEDELAVKKAVLQRMEMGSLLFTKDESMTMKGRLAGDPMGRFPAFTKASARGLIP